MIGDREIKNARIKSTMLGMEDPGIFTFSIDLDYGSSGQGFGGYSLDTPLKDKDDKFIRRIGTALGMTCIMDLLECLEVSRWEALSGVYVRADASYEKVYRIGHLLKDKWFCFDDVFKKEGLL